MGDNRFKSEIVVDPRRIYVAIVFFAVLVLSLVGRLWYLQILKGRDFSIASERNRVRGRQSL